MSARNVSRHAHATFAALVVAALVGLVAFAASSGSPVTSSRLPLVQATETAASRAVTRPPDTTPAVVGPTLSIVILVVACVAVGVPVLYFLVRFALLLLGIRRATDVKGQRWDDEEVRLDSGELLADPARAERLLHGVDAGLAELGATDPRRAVIECWVRLERAARDLEVARRPEETATDLAVRVLAAHHVRRDSLDALLGLYHEARYSPHDITAGDVEAARSALGEVRADLLAIRAGVRP